MRVGVHTSIAGCLANAAHHAKKIGCDTFQMFSANPRGWSALAPSAADCESFRSARHSYGHAPVVIHDNYLINLASSDAVIRERSIATFRRNLCGHSRSARIISLLIPEAPRAARLPRQSRTCVESLRQAAAGLKLDGLTILIENTAGQGACIGRSFEEVAEIMAGAGKGSADRRLHRHRAQF